jgi:hypothetical protein
VRGRASRGRGARAGLLLAILALALIVGAFVAGPALAAGAGLAATTSPPAHSGGSDLTWGTLVVAVVAAIFAGGFLGNMYASNRLRPPTVSVYGIIEQRLREAKEG